jgi:hypothetical protein
MTVLYRLLLVLSSISLTVAIFLVNKRVSVIGAINDWVVEVFPRLVIYNWPDASDFMAIASYIIYFMACVVIHLCVFRATRSLPIERVDLGSYKSIELVNDTFLPVYLAYFFVALSTTSYLSFGVIFGIVFIFVYRSGGVYFDPIYVFRGYKVYAAISRADVKTYVISRRIIKGVASIEFESIRRINDFTFIDMGES